MRLIAATAIGTLALVVATAAHAQDPAKRAQLQIPDSGYRDEPFPGIKALYPGEAMDLSVSGSVDIMHRFYTVTVSCGFLGLGRCDEDREDANWRTPATHGIQLRVTPKNGVPFESPVSVTFKPSDIMADRWVQKTPDPYGQGGLRYHYQVDFSTDDARRMSSYQKPYTFGMRIAPFGVAPTKCAGQRYGECSMGHYDIDLYVDADRRISFLETLLASGPLSPTDLASADLIDTTTSASPRAAELAEAVASHAQRYYRGSAGFQPVAIPILQRAALLAPNSAAVNGLLIDALISNGRIAEAEAVQGKSLDDTAKAYSNAARPRAPDAVLNYDRALGNDSRLRETASLGEIPADLQLSASSQLKRLGILDEALKRDQWSDQYQQRYAEASIVLSRTQSMFRTRQSLERASQHLDDAARIMSHKDAGELVGSDPDGSIYANAAYPRDVSTKVAYAAYLALTPADAGDALGVTALKADPTAIAAPYFVLSARDHKASETPINQLRFWSPTAPAAPAFTGYLQDDGQACKPAARALIDTRWELRLRSLVAAGIPDAIATSNLVPVIYENHLALWDPVTGGCSTLERGPDSRSKVVYDVFSTYAADKAGVVNWTPDLEAPLKVPGWVALEVTAKDAPVTRQENKPGIKATQQKEIQAPKATSYRMVLRTDAQSWNSTNASQANLVYADPSTPLALGFALNADATWLDTGRPVAVLLEGTTSQVGDMKWKDPILDFMNPPSQWQQTRDVTHAYQLAATTLWQLTDDSKSLCAIPLQFSAQFHQSGKQIWDQEKKAARDTDLGPGTYTESGALVPGKSTSIASPCFCTIPYGSNDHIRMIPQQSVSSHGVVVIESGVGASRTLTLRNVVDLSDRAGNSTCPEVPLPVADGAPETFSAEFPTVTSAALTERLISGGGWSPSGMLLDLVRSSPAHQAASVQYPMKPGPTEKGVAYLPETAIAIGEDDTPTLSSGIRPLLVEKLGARAYIPSHSVNAILGVTVRSHEWSSKGPLRCMTKRAAVVLPSVLSAVAWVRTPSGHDVPDLVRGGDLAVVLDGGSPPAAATPTPSVQATTQEAESTGCDAFDAAGNAWRRLVTDLGCEQDGRDCDVLGLQGAEAGTDALAIIRREELTGVVEKWTVVTMRVDQGCQSDATTGARYSCIRLRTLRTVEPPKDTYAASLPLSDKVRWTSQLVFTSAQSGVPPIAGDQGGPDKSFEVDGTVFTLATLSTGKPFKLTLKAAEPANVRILGIRTVKDNDSPAVAYWSRGEIRTMSADAPRTMVPWGQQRNLTWFPIAPLAAGIAPGLVIVEGNGSAAPRFDLFGAPLTGDGKDVWSVARSIARQLYTGTALPPDAWGASRFAKAPVVAIASSAAAVGVAGPRCVVLAQSDSGQDFAWARDFAPGTLAGVSAVPPTSTALLARCAAKPKASKDTPKGNQKPEQVCTATDFARAYEQTKTTGPSAVIGIQSVAGIDTARSADQGAYYRQDPTTLLHRWQLQSKQNQFAEVLRTGTDAAAQGRFCEKVKL